MGSGDDDLGKGDCIWTMLLLWAPKSEERDDSKDFRLPLPVEPAVENADTASEKDRENFESNICS